MSDEEEGKKLDGVLYYATKFNENGIPIVEAPLTPVEDTRTKYIVAPSPFIIPVVFIPGIMGTNLKISGNNGKPVWRPPNADLRGTFEVIGTLITYLRKNAIRRKEELNKNAVEIDLDGPIDPTGTGLPEKILRERGWGGVMRASYHPLMGRIQQELSGGVAKLGVLQGWAAGHGRDTPADWGAGEDAPALTREELLQAGRYRYDVWGGCYNWLASNRDAGRAIKHLIENTILPWYEKRKLVAKKVIVVTHSMGGLVSRALTEIHGCDKVLGVVHGVQPATGAPATYKRMRAGFEGPAQVILGRDAGDVTAVLCGAPGGLELLPSFDYNGGQPWLKVRDKGSKREPLALPENGDPYTEIYMSPAWYGLVPQANEGLMEPGKQGASSGDPNAASPRKDFHDVIKRVETFHRDISTKYRDPSYVHYGTQGTKLGGLTGGDRYTWGDVVWQVDRLDGFDPKTAVVAKDNHNGVLTLADGRRLAIADPDTPGDGTVPAPSGRAPAGNTGVQAVFVHGQDAPGKHNEKFGYEHQDSYNDERAMFATLYGIVKIAQKADWRPK